MKKLIILLLLGASFSCSPYQRLMLHHESRSRILIDSCEIALLSQFHAALSHDSLAKGDPARIFSELQRETECSFLQSHVFPQRPTDSDIWVYTIKTCLSGQKEVFIGSLFTLFPGYAADSTFVLERRIKQYNQGKEFERGRYMVFHYSLMGDSILSIKTGESEHLRYR